MIGEYPKVAALICIDIDVAFKAAETKPEMAMALLKMLKDKKDGLVNNKKLRDTRYSSTVAALSIGYKND